MNLVFHKNNVLLSKSFILTNHSTNPKRFYFTFSIGYYTITPIHIYMAVFNIINTLYSIFPLYSIVIIL